MSWADVAGAAAADIHSAFADAEISIEPKASAAIVGVAAVEVDYQGDDPMGYGKSVRQHGYEVRKADVPEKPANGAKIVHGSAIYRVIEVRDGRDVGAWMLMVEDE
ncbi:MAG: hypothetical protein J0H88_08410 [Sphingomonadales bacterium]|nr:hypothetical protein [Sphingomonadales bacterium]